jgi:hypothetical protein
MIVESMGFLHSDIHIYNYFLTPPCWTTHRLIIFQMIEDILLRLSGLVQNSFVSPTGAAVRFLSNKRSGYFPTFDVHMCKNSLEENFIIRCQSKE